MKRMGMSDYMMPASPDSKIYNGCPLDVATVWKPAWLHIHSPSTYSAVLRNLEDGPYHPSQRNSPTVARSLSGTEEGGAIHHPWGRVKDAPRQREHRWQGLCPCRSTPERPRGMQCHPIAPNVGLKLKGLLL